ncbi:MAG: Wzz/FepE/Etk N-terminal domain-containing protein [Acidobacteriaceae bacterium]
MATETRYPGLQESAGSAGQPPERKPKAPDDEISLLDLLIILAERKRTILLVTAACAILSIGVSLLLPNEYTATVVLLPPQQNSSLGAALASQLGSLGSMAQLAGSSLGIKNPNDMYVAMLKSETVEDGMIRDFALQREYHEKLLSDARKALEKRAGIDGTGKDGLIRVSMEDRNPERAAQLANGYVGEFRKLSQNLAITEASQRVLFFGQQMEQAKDNLANAEEALKQTEQTTGLIQLDSQARALIESAASLRAQIAAKEVQIQAMQTYATGENAQLVEAQQELDGLRTQLARLGGSEEGPNSLLVPKGKVPEAGLEYVRRLRDVKYYETIFDILARQFEVAKLDQAKEGALVQVVDPAIVPDRKSSPKRTIIVVVSTVAGFFLGILVALFQMAWARLKSDPEHGPKVALLWRALRGGPGATP